MKTTRRGFFAILGAAIASKAGPGLSVQQRVNAGIRAAEARKRLSEFMQSVQIDRGPWVFYDRISVTPAKATFQTFGQEYR